MYLQHEFLSIIQAIESYHRRIHNGKYLSDIDYEKIYDTLVEAISKEVDKDLKESLKQKLKYHNEFSLRKRLKEILKKCGVVVNLSNQYPTEFVEDVVNTRNFLTHYDKSIEFKVKSGADLYQLVQKLKFILEICFLIELEIPKERIRSLASRNQRNRAGY